jgi:hypothetical protein
MSCRAPASLDVRRSTAMPALRGLVSGPWPLRAYLKRSFVNHQQPRTAFASDSGHSSLAAGTRLYAPLRPLTDATRIGSGGGNASCPDLSGV